MQRCPIPFHTVDTVQAHITYAINWVVAAFFSLDLVLRVVAYGFLLTPTAYMHVSLTIQYSSMLIILFAPCRAFSW